MNFLPGPVAISREVLRAFEGPPESHRSAGYTRDLQRASWRAGVERLADVCSFSAVARFAEQLQIPSIRANHCARGNHPPATIGFVARGPTARLLTLPHRLENPMNMKNRWRSLNIKGHFARRLWTACIAALFLHLAIEAVGPLVRSWEVRDIDQDGQGWDELRSRTFRGEVAPRARLDRAMQVSVHGDGNLGQL